VRNTAAPEPLAAGRIDRQKQALALHLVWHVIVGRRFPARLLAALVLMGLAQELILVLAALSNPYLASGYLLATLARRSALLHAADEVAEAEWLHHNFEWDETVLATYEADNWIAGTISHQAVLSHWAETVDYEVKRLQVAAFYAGGRTGAELHGMLDKWGVRGGYAVPREQALGGLDVAVASYLGPVFSCGDAANYRMREQP
jgi:hypothetical protein